MRIDLFILLFLCATNALNQIQTKELNKINLINNLQWCQFLNGNIYCIEENELKEKHIDCKQEKFYVKKGGKK